ncbi:hypothetical protein [Nitratireductor sp. XY-223]|uniref:hypothetical protein n=1 Tax=Nitratireductor sp. XY-223 TaxID=2561926 RepID=UPI0010AA9000|nr:hypothetical protein [Nitratireductor sp. XY-223]
MALLIPRRDMTLTVLHIPDCKAVHRGILSLFFLHRQLIRVPATKSAREPFKNELVEALEESIVEGICAERAILLHCSFGRIRRALLSCFSNYWLWIRSRHIIQ